MLATEAELLKAGLLADLTATLEADEAADDSDDEMDEAATEATEEADEADALGVSHCARTLPSCTYTAEAEATEAAEVALAPAELAYELADWTATDRAEETEAVARSNFSSAVSLDEVKSSRTLESFSSANSTPLLTCSRMAARICSTLFWLWT